MGWPWLWQSQIGRSDQASVSFWRFGLLTKTNLWSDTDVGRCSPGTRDAVSMVDPCDKQSGLFHEFFLGVLVLGDIVAVYADVATEQLQSYPMDQAFGVAESVRGFVRGDTEMFDDDGSCWEMVNRVEKTLHEQFSNHRLAEIPAGESLLAEVGHHLNSIMPA